MISNPPRLIDVTWTTHDVDSTYSPNDIRAVILVFDDLGWLEVKIVFHVTHPPVSTGLDTHRANLATSASLYPCQCLGMRGIDSPMRRAIRSSPSI